MSLVTGCNGLGKQGRQQRSISFLVVLLEYRVSICREKAQVLTFNGCT
jgi:hypothetical protein